MIEAKFCSVCCPNISRGPNLEVHRQEMIKLFTIIAPNGCLPHPVRSVDDSIAFPCPVIPDYVILGGGVGNNRISFFSPGSGRVYKFETHYRDRKELELFCHEGAGDVRLNDIFSNIYGGRFGHLATFAHAILYNSEAPEYVVSIIDAPWISGKAIGVLELNQFGPTLFAELNRLEMYHMDIKPENFILLDNFLLPIDAKFICSKRSNSPYRSNFPVENCYGRTLAEETKRLLKEFYEFTPEQTKAKNLSRAFWNKRLNPWDLDPD